MKSPYPRGGSAVEEAAITMTDIKDKPGIGS
jgi:hypothetical protein